MPNWSNILKEIQSQPSPLDIVRKKYINKLHEHTGRNIITYYSGFLNGVNDYNLSINDQDMSGFMNAINQMDSSKGLDLILHTPGGSIAATESIVSYLRSKFGTNIRAIIPQISMSAGTMIALSCSEIVMGIHSNIGPIDPQVNGVPAYNIINEFNQAKQDLQNNANVPYWQLQLSKYPPAYILECENAIKLSTELVTEWLKSGMFSDYSYENIDKIVLSLNEHENSKTHSRHYDINFCKNLGLKITDLESDVKLQDLVLSLHHVYTHTFSNTPAIKIIESNVQDPYIISLR
ncbi:serine protease [Clostridium perfringens]|uniref:SDH family Clp fold serine proteinase n=1 Tax=Clostridium perfringens TaxID=1502 RepID=UPI001DD5C1B9|nr:serine protease [Clostridium perfringens]EJT6160059.1 serine protease [Clostridium perfringens]MDK0620564.1 serine protease [Clostridium perfringens]